MDNRLGPDLITDLPLDIIENILIRVPIRDAIKTSILSTKWRYRWVSLPHLVFDTNNMITSLQNEVDETFIKNFITRTLSRHEGPIHTFKLKTCSMDSYPDVDQLLLLLSWKDIKELILYFESDYDDCVPVPSTMYSFRNLTVLELYGCVIGPPPLAFKGFPCLRSLILDVDNSYSGTIESLVADSPLLENLKCLCVGDFDLRISAPNLKYFCIEEPYREIFLSAPLLAKMTVTLDPENERFWHCNWQKHSGCNYTKFLGGVTNIESLTGGELFTKYLSIGIQYCDPPLVFHRLKDITLSKVNFLNVNELLVVVRLIMDTTNLHELQVGCSPYKSADELNAPHKDFWEKECPQNCRFENLKLIKITDFRALLHETKFIKFLLESSPVLEAVSVELFRCPIQQEILDSIVELLSYPRASSNAKILFKIMQMPSLRR